MICITVEQLDKACEELKAAGKVPRFVYMNAVGLANLEKENRARRYADGERYFRSTARFIVMRDDDLKYMGEIGVALIAGGWDLA